jgi:hemoglobin
MAEQTLYERLGGVFTIAAVVNHFSDALIENPVVGQGSDNPELRDWHTNRLERLPGLKFMRTLWVCNVAGGPFTFQATKPGSTALGLEEAHREFRITPEEFDEVAAELGRSLDHFGVPAREKDEVLAAFAAQGRGDRGIDGLGLRSPPTGSYGTDGSRTATTLNAGTGRRKPLSVNSPAGSTSTCSSTSARRRWAIRTWPALASSASRDARFVTAPIAA